MTDQETYWVTMAFGPIPASSQEEAVRSVVEDLNADGIGEDGSAWVTTTEPTEPLGAVEIHLDDEDDDEDEF